MNERSNGSGVWVRAIMSAAVAALVGISALQMNAQARRDDGQDKILAEVQSKCDDLGAIKADIGWIKEGIQELKSRR